MWTEMAPVHGAPAPAAGMGISTPLLTNDKGCWMDLMLPDGSKQGMGLLAGNEIALEPGGPQHPAKELKLKPKPATTRDEALPVALLVAGRARRWVRPATAPLTSQERAFEQKL